jgi:hypothetical protein
VSEAKNGVAGPGPSIRLSASFCSPGGWVAHVSLSPFVIGLKGSKDLDIHFSGQDTFRKGAGCSKNLKKSSQVLSTSAFANRVCGTFYFWHSLEPVHIECVSTFEDSFELLNQEAAVRPKGLLN